MGDIQEIKILAGRLATMFRGDLTKLRPCACACTGLCCLDTGCRVWWMNFLTLYSDKDIAKMVEIHLAAFGYPQDEKVS